MPHEGNEKSQKELQKSLHHIGYGSEKIILEGDFNFPGWNWKNNTLKNAFSHNNIGTSEKSWMTKIYNK